MFGIDVPIKEGSKINDISHPFWHDDEVKNDIRLALVNNERLNKEYISGNDKSNFRRVHISSKSMVGEDVPEKRLLLVVKEV